MSYSARSGAGRARRQRVDTAVLLAVLTLLAVCEAGAAAAPRLRELLKQAPLVVAGEVTAVTPYDDERVTVIAVTASHVFKGSLTAPAPIELVALQDGGGQRQMSVGERGLMFLRPAPRTSYLERVLPACQRDELLPQFGAFVAADTAQELTRQIEVLQAVVAAARGRGLDATAARRLTFDLLACLSPLMVEDGIAGVADLRTGGALSAEEADILRNALTRTALPERVRVALVGAVGAAGLTEMVPTLRTIDSPPALMAAAWQALERLGAPLSDDALAERLSARQASTRAVAVRELLRIGGVAAVPRAEPLALRDPDATVRLAAVEAIAALRDPAVLPPLEAAFGDESADLRQAAARGIMNIGGAPAVRALSRLAMNGPIEAQRYAVLILLTIDDPSRAAVVERIGQTHPDQETRDLIAHGLHAHDH